MAKPLALKQRRCTEEKIGLFFAALVIGGLAIGGIVMAVPALLGVL